MAKRFTDTELWDKEWFMKLSSKQKLLVKMVRDKCDLAGVWSPNWTIASIYIGETVNENLLLEIDGGKQFEKLANGKILCIDFVNFQYGELSEKSPVHRKVIQILNTHEIGNKYPINRVQDKEEEKDKVKEEDKDKHELSDFLKECPNVRKLKSQLTNEEILKLKEKYKIEQIKKIILQMENYKKLTTNYKSVYLTANNWLDREFGDKKKSGDRKNY